MMHHDLTQWPLVITVASAPLSDDDQIGFFHAWGEWLDRNEPFAVLRYFSDSAPSIRPDGEVRYARQWLQEKAPKIRENVLGMATVLPPPAYEQLGRGGGQRLFGVPAEVFCVKTAAIDWIVETLFLPRGFPFNRTAIGHRLAR